MNAVMCRWASTKPNTWRFGRGPLNGLPVAFTSASGNVAQPCAPAIRNEVLPPSESLRPPRVVEPIETCPGRGVTIQCHSALGPGELVGPLVLSSLPSWPSSMNVPSPVGFTKTRVVPCAERRPTHSLAGNPGAATAGPGTPSDATPRTTSSTLLRSMAGTLA